MYQKLAYYYDYIFPTGKVQLNFFKDEFSAYNVMQVLDLACGSGNYSIEFARWGLDVTGVDYEQAMIDYAKTKLEKESELNVDFFQGDMRNLSQPDSIFDAVVCIGNSLVHLLTEDDIALALGEMHRVCKSKGLLILQILNYDHIIEKNVTILPDIKNNEPNLTFTRQYEFRDDGLINFHTSLILNSDQQQQSVDHGSVLLRPLRPQILKKLLTTVGFNEIELFGGFNRSPLSIDTSALVIKALKK